MRTPCIDKKTSQSGQAIVSKDFELMLKYKKYHNSILINSVNQQLEPANLQ